MSGLAIISGRGLLPQLLAEECAKTDRPYLVVSIAGIELDWSSKHPVYQSEFEKFGALFAALHKDKISSVVFAGGVRRPNFDMTRLDEKTKTILPDLAIHMAGGDGGTLQAVAKIFEAEGFQIEAAHQLLSGLLAPVGALGEFSPSKADFADMKRAMEIVTAIGVLDIGQGAVVAQQLCLGVETLQGTDAMLECVAQSKGLLLPDPNGAKGVLFKGPKPRQDLRMDMPAVGPHTLENAAKAGLGGVAVVAGKTLLLNPSETREAADKLGLFLYGTDEASG